MCTAITSKTTVQQTNFKIKNQTDVFCGNRKQ